MRRPIFIMLCLSLLTLWAPRPAAAQECGPAVKYVYMRSYGFVPDRQYICGGQTVVLINATGNYVSFNYRDYLNREVLISNLRLGGYTILSAPTQIYNVWTYGRYGYKLVNGEVRSGMAPDSY